jgi:hypothetical protein
VDQNSTIGMPQPELRCCVTGKENICIYCFEVVRVSIRSRRIDRNYVNREKKWKGTTNRYTKEIGQQMRNDRKRNSAEEEREIKEFRKLKKK